MPKKISVNSKAEEARARKEEANSEKKDREVRDREDAKWREEGVKTKAAKKKEEDAERKAEAAAKKAEAKALAEQEERELAKLSKKGSKVEKTAAPKMTAAELAKMKEKEQKQREADAAAAKKKSARMTDETEYERLIAVENTNRVEALVDARSVGEALSQISVSEGSVADKHPERRLKASFKAFEEVELQRLRAEKPGLSLTQYKDLVWKEWKKSPQNPLNQASQ